MPAPFAMRAGARLLRPRPLGTHGLRPGRRCRSETRCPSSGGQRARPSSARPMPSCRPKRGLGFPRRRFRSETWVPTRPFPGTPNAELTGTQRRGARAVRPMMTKAAARPGCHAVAGPVERLVRRLDATVRSPACGRQCPSRCGPERNCRSRGHCVPLEFMADDAGARCSAHHQEDSERVLHRRARCQAASRSEVLAFREGGSGARHGFRLGLSLGRLTQS
jgi:hypothetical protein